MERKRKSFPRAGPWFAALLFFAASNAYGGLKPPTPDESDAFFTNGIIPHLKIEITGTNLTFLQHNNRKYVRAKVTDGTTVYRDVGIHLKGAAGSFRPLEDKPALTLNFNKFNEDQKFHGIDKLHLNNSVQDPSYMTELLCGDLFLAAGVPTPRATHARVELNGRPVGLYVLKEGFDKTFLRRHFTNAKGNLYDGGFIRDITDRLELDEGNEGPPHADLRRLATASMETDSAKRWSALEQLLDMNSMLSFMALEMMTWHWDGYVMKRNNYRVYHEPTSDKIYFLPHGMDQMFWVPEAPLIPVNPDGLVAAAILRTPQGRKEYRQRVGLLLTNVFTAERLTNRIRQMHRRIRPVLASIDEGEARSHDHAISNLREQVTARVEAVQRLLQQPEPKPLQFEIGNAQLTQWRMHNIQGAGTLDRVEDSGTKALRVRVNQPGNPSWRTRVVLEPGQYRFEARIKTARVSSFQSERGQGAGLRISGSRRSNRISGDTDWKTLAFEFPVSEAEQEVELVCELTAIRGEAWFDLNSLRLIKRP
jgi:spore coat protein H